MPRYYFDVLDGRLFTDEEGTEFPDLAAARTEALRSLPEMATDLVAIEDGHEVSITMRDDAGRPILAATLTIDARWLDDATAATHPQPTR